MDFLRSGYQRDVRLWLDDNTTVRIRWFRAARNAEVFTQPSYYRSAVWDDYAFTRPVGEEKDEAMRWDRGLNSVGYPGDHFCGNAQAIVNGGVHGVDEPIITGDDGSCDCCHAAVQIATNGIGDAPIALFATADIRYDGNAPVGEQSGNVFFGIGYDGNAPVGIQANLIVTSTYVYFNQSSTATSFTDWIPYLLPYLDDLIPVGDGTGPVGEQGGTMPVQAWIDGSVSSGGGTTINGSANIASFSSSSLNQLSINFVTPPPSGFLGVGIAFGPGATTGNALVCFDLGVVGSTWSFAFLNSVTQTPEFPTSFKAVWAW